MSSDIDDKDPINDVAAAAGAAATAPGWALIRWADLDEARANCAGLATASVRHPAEPRIARLFANVSDPPLLGRAALGRIEARLLETDAKTRTRRNAGGATSSHGYRRFAMGSGLGVFTLLLSGAVIAGGGVGAWWTLSRPHSAAITTAPPASEANGTRRSRRGHAPRNAVQHSPTSADRAPVDISHQGVGGERAGGEGRAAPTTAVSKTAVSETAVSETAVSKTTASKTPDSETAAPTTPDGPTPTAPVMRPSTQRSLSAPVHAAPANAKRHLAMARLGSTVRSWPPGSAPLVQPAPSGLSEEARLLNRATIELRQRRNAVAALGSLDEYLRRFPGGGTLANEAQRLRVDALLLLGRNDEVLRVLARLEPEAAGRGLELLTIRGELRARVDCATATRDFDQVLRHQRVGRLAERALYGRAVCALRERRDQTAREDASAYLERFPRGRFAPEARQIVRGSAFSSEGAHRPSRGSPPPGRDPDPKGSPPGL